MSDAVIKRWESTSRKVKEFAELLDSIDTLDSKRKVLWKEIYQNALEDRLRAETLYAGALSSITTDSANDHAILGSTMTKYLERMGKSNEQILKLAELIVKVEEREARLDTEALMDQIEGG
jgi:hypothetical protein